MRDASSTSTDRKQKMIVKVRTWVVPEGDTTARMASDEFIDRIDRLADLHDDQTDIQGTRTHALGFTGKWLDRTKSVLVKTLRVYRDNGSFETIEIYTATDSDVASVECWLMGNDGGTIDRLI